MSQTRYKLRVNLVGKTCSFVLEGSDGKSRDGDLRFPDQLFHAYDHWQKAYDRYYTGRLRDKPSATPPEPTPESAVQEQEPRRSKVIAKGTLKEPKDQRLALVKAEAILLDQFHQWLRDANLHEIRNELLQAAIAAQQDDHPTGRVEVFLTTKAQTVALLPWESWNLGHELGDRNTIQIARTPTRTDPKTESQLSGKRIRLLAIMGDDSGLNFANDVAAVQSLKPTVTVKFEGYRGAEDNASDLKKRICRAIADEEGWDVLFFAGHSSEQKLIGGELSLAPGVSMAFKELKKPLKTACQQGLKLALFNSCKGLDIAETAVSFGLTQVVVMREIIHDEVAPLFLRHFTEALKEHQDCFEALQQARTALKDNPDFPSADLVPSVFAHPQTTWFRIPQTGWKYQLRRRLPTWREAASVAGLLLVGLLPPVQDLLIDVRVGAQALYRQATAQIPARSEPPVTLIQIDSESLERANAQRRPIDRSYLANLLTTLTDLGAPVIGIDYILDDHEQPENFQSLVTTPEDRTKQLQQAIQNAQNRDVALVFGYYDAVNQREDSNWGKVSESLIEPELAVHGDITFLPWYLEMLTATTSECLLPACPFAYQLALDFARTQSAPQALDINSVQAEANAELVRPTPQDWMETWEWLSQLKLPSIHQFSYNFGQVWLQPILDFSLPPGAVYRPIVAHNLLNPSEQAVLDVTAIQNSVVIVAPGGYAEAGVDEEGQDNFTTPTGVWAWSRQENFSGGEAHAYMVHHFLTRHLVYPVPDVWLILLAAWLGKEIRIRFPRSQQEQRKWLRLWGLASLGYGVIGLQIYVSLGILFPWLLPNLMLGRYLQLAKIRGHAD